MTAGQRGVADCGKPLGSPGPTVWESYKTVEETPLRVYGDARNVYIDDVGSPFTVNLLVRYLGGPVPTDVTLDLAPAAPGTLPPAPFLSFPATVTVPTGGDAASVQVVDVGGAAGFVSMNVNVGGDTVWFVNFRRYPVDDYSAQIAAGPLAWEFVYEQTLRYYYVLFPAMSKRIPLNDEPTIRATAAEILKRLSPRYHDTTLRMPVTRSLSPGKVALLTTYLRQQAGTGA